MKKLPLGKQVYRTLIEDDFIYVDKTPFLTELADSGIPTFLSRPRRFGKSLTVSTFKELFSGSRDLFIDTYAYDNWDFDKTSPVIKLDMSVVSVLTIEEMKHSLLTLVLWVAEDYNLKLEERVQPQLAFGELIRGLRNKNGIAVLIDEYDAPILNSMDTDILPDVKKVLRNFYNVLKEQEENIRFLFITGISRFSKVGIFSTLNNLNDITLNKKYSAVCGYTEDEINNNFSSNIESCREELNLTKKEFWEKLKHYYNGYSWDGRTFLFNPFSVLGFFENQVFAPYWIDTGSPSFIVKYAENNNLELDKLEGIVVDRAFMSQKDIDDAAPESFLMQAGYLTIKKSEEDEYILGFPNYEVRYSFNHLILTNRYRVDNDDYIGVRRAVRTALKDNNTEAFLEQIKVIFSSVTHHHYDANKNEYFYSALLLMFLQAAGFDVTAEKTTNRGRLDLILTWKDKRVYILELKLDSAEKALKQIKDKNYHGRYINKECILIGLSINYEKRNVSNWAVEEINF